MSPVDGADPYGILPLYVITPGEKVNFTIPTLQLVTGFDPIPGIYKVKYRIMFKSSF